MEIEFEFLEPWKKVDSISNRLEEELQKEANEQHPLFKKKVKTIARRIDCDDVLFEMEEGGFALVHLTWREKKEESSDFPYTLIFKTWSEVYEKVILEDHREINDFE